MCPEHPDTDVISNHPNVDVTNSRASSSDASERKLLSGTVMTEKQAVLLDVALNGSAEECQVFTSALPPYRIVAVTPAWTRLCGYSEAEAVGQTCKMLQGPATSPKVLEKLHSALREERPCAVRLLNYRKSGQPFINDLTVDPCCDVEGRITHFRGTLRAWEAGRPDVPRVYLPPDDETLVEVIHEEYPSTIEEAQAITNLPVVITGFQQPFRIIYVNNRWCQMWGFSVEEAIGRTCGILQGPGTCKMTLDALRQAALEQRPISVRLLNYTKDRRPVMNTLSVAPIPPVSIGVPAQHLVGMMRSHSIDTENESTPLFHESSAACNNAAAKGAWQQPTGMSPSDSQWPWASPPQLPMIEKGALQRVEQRLHSALERISDQPRNSQSYQPSIPRSSQGLPQQSTQKNQPQRQWQAHHAQSHSHLAAASQDSSAPLNSDYRALFDGTAPVNMLVNLVQQLQVQQLLQQQQLLMQQQMFQTNPVPLRGKGNASDGVELALLIQDFEELNTQFELTELLYLKWRESANQQLASCWGHALLQLPWLGALEAAFLPFPRQTHCSMGMDDSDAASRVSLRASSNSAGGTAVTRRPLGANREDGPKRRAIGGTTRSGCCADTSSSKGSHSAKGACSVNLGDESCHADMLPTWPPQQSSRHRAPSAHGARRDDEALESESAGSSSSIEPNTTNSLSSEPRDSSESMSSEPHTAQGQRKRSCDASESKRPSSRLRQMPGSQPLASKQSSPTEDQAAQPECHSSPSQQHITSSEPSPREGPGSSPSQPQTPQKS